MQEIKGKLINHIFLSIYEFPFYTNLFVRGYDLKMHVLNYQMKTLFMKINFNYFLNEVWCNIKTVKIYKDK